MLKRQVIQKFIPAREPAEECKVIPCRSLLRNSNDYLNITKNTSFSSNLSMLLSSEKRISFL